MIGVLGLGLVLGLWGIRWGIPGPGRFQAFPERFRSDPELAKKAAERWAALYRDIWRSHSEGLQEPATYIQGIAEFPSGWQFPPGNLLNSYRSFMLQSEHPDEKKSFIILSQMRPWRMNFQPIYTQYGGSFIYPLGVFLAASSWAGAARITSDVSHYLMHPEDMGRLYVCGRIFLLLFHLGTLWVLYDMGVQLGGWRCGLGAAVGFCLCPSVQVHSHVLKPHPYAAFWFLAAVRHWLMSFRGGSRSDYWKGGLCAGLAAGANLSLGFCAVFPALIFLFRRWGMKSGPKEWMDACWAVAAVIFTCLAANPYLLLAYKNFAWEMSVSAPARFGVHARGLLAMFGSVFPASLGVGLAVASALAFFRVLRRRDPERGFLAFVMAFSFVMLWLRFGEAAPSVSAARLYYPLFGLASLLAADALAAARLPKIAKLLIVAAILTDCVQRTAPCLENMRRDSGPLSTRRRAADWIMGHLPQGASLGLVRYPEPAHTPAFRFDRYRLIVFERDELLGRKLPDYLVVHEQGLPQIDRFARNNYDAIGSFLPLRPLWGPMDDTAFAGAAMFVFRRKGLGGLS